MKELNEILSMILKRFCTLEMRVVQPNEKEEEL